MILRAGGPQWGLSRVDSGGWDGAGGSDVFFASGFWPASGGVAGVVVGEGAAPGGLSGLAGLADPLGAGLDADGWTVSARRVVGCAFGLAFGFFFFGLG